MTRTRDAENYKELSQRSEAYRKWLNMKSYRRRNIRQRIQRENNRCFYCNKRPIEPQLCHKIALSKGGTNDETNLVVGCKSCNLKARNS